MTEYVCEELDYKKLEALVAATELDPFWVEERARQREFQREVQEKGMTLVQAREKAGLFNGFTLDLDSINL